MFNKTSIYVISFFILSCNFLFGQGQGNIWCFPDSTGIDFNDSIAMPYNSVLSNTVEPSSSISDNNGNLLFYMSGSMVWNRNNQAMPNGSNVFNDYSSTQGVIIIPFPNDNLKYYLFNFNPFSPFGFYFSVIDMNLDGGLGDVIPWLKNIKLLNIQLSEKLTAVRHCNGNDWWVFVHGMDNNTFYKFIVTNGGINLYNTQNIGSYHSIIPPSGLAGGSQGEMEFSRDGTKLAVVNLTGIIDIFDFNRYTGQLSNWLELGDDSSMVNLLYYGCSFSHSGKVLYISSTYPNNEIIQFDLNNDLVIDIISSKTIIWQATTQEYFGQLQLAPDYKIYLASGDANEGWPLTDVTSFYNQYLSVINNPDTVGFGCNLSTHSFYLGGNNSLLSLPNHPNYNLGPTTPVCDTTFIVCPLANFSHTDTGLTAYFKNSSLASAGSWYYWIFGDGATDTVENPEHTYGSASTYTVAMIVGNSCGSDTIIQQVSVEVLGVREQVLNKTKLYPNPNDGNMQLDYQLPEDGNGELLTFDIMGKKLFTYNLVNGRNTLKINEVSLQNGLYYYQIMINDKIVSTDKLIILK